MDDSNIKVIGFDLGHGETAVSKIESVSSNHEPERLKLQGEYVQPTAIAYDNMAGVLFGRQALNSKDAKSFHIGFKSKPAHNEQNRDLLKDYFKSIYEHLLVESFIDETEKHVVFVGCPSGWSDASESNDIEAYRELLRSGIDNSNIDIEVVKESRAALMNAIESEKLSLGEISETILVLDIGSSTTDLTLVDPTLVKELSDKSLDFGINLGGSLIDKAIFEYSLTHHDNKDKLEAAFEKYPMALQRCIYKCRKYKEDYFKNEVDYIKDPENEADLGREKVPQSLKFQPKLNHSIMEELLSSSVPKSLELELDDYQGWRACFRDLLLNAKQQLAEPPNVILITGGGGLMNFTYKIAQEVFPTSKIKRDPEPAHCISKGLSRWGRAKISTQKFMDEIEIFIQDTFPEIVKSHEPRFRKELTELLVDGLLEEVIEPRILAWKSGEIKTINELQPDIERYARDWISAQSTKRLIVGKIISWENLIKKEVGQGVQHIYGKFGIPLGAIQFSSSHVVSIDENVAISPEQFEKLIPGINIATWLTRIITLIVALVFVELGPIAWIIGIVAVIWSPNLAKGGLKDANIPLLVRKAVSRKKIRKTIGEKREEIQEHIQKELDDNELFVSLIDAMSEQVRRNIQATAEKAKLLIVR